MNSLKDRLSISKLLTLGFAVSLFVFQGSLFAEITASDDNEQEAVSTKKCDDDSCSGKKKGKNKNRRRKKTVRKNKGEGKKKVTSDKKKETKGKVAKKVKNKKVKKNREEVKKEKARSECEQNKSRCVNLHRELIYYSNIVTQNEDKINNLSARKKVIEPQIASDEKELRSLKKKYKVAKDKRTECVKSRAVLCGERKKNLGDLKKGNEQEIEAEVDKLTKKISAKMTERLQLTTEMQQIAQLEESRNAEYQRLKKELKSLDNEVFQLKRENKRLRKLNDRIKKDLGSLEQSIKESETLYTPLSMFD